MRVLCDVHIPFRLVNRLREMGVDTTHVNRMLECRFSSCAAVQASRYPYSSSMSPRTEFPDLLQFRLFRLLRFEQVPAHLQVQPEIGRHSEKARQTQCSAWRDAALLVHQFVDALIRIFTG